MRVGTITLSLEEIDPDGLLTPEARIERRATQELHIDVRDDSGKEIAGAIVPIYYDEPSDRVRFEMGDRLILYPERRNH